MKYLAFSFLLLFIASCKPADDSPDQATVTTAYERYLANKKANQENTQENISSSSTPEEIIIPAKVSSDETAEPSVDEVAELVEVSADEVAEPSAEATEANEEASSNEKETSPLAEESSPTEQTVFSIEDEIRLGLLNTLNEDTVIVTKLAEPTKSHLLAGEESTKDTSSSANSESSDNDAILLAKPLEDSPSLESSNENLEATPSGEDSLVDKSSDESLEPVEQVETPNEETADVLEQTPSEETPAVEQTETPSEETTAPIPFEDLSVLERMTPTEEQFNVLFQACHQFKRAQKCFLNTKGYWGAGRCALGWTGPIRKERDKLISSGLTTREEYDAKKEGYNYYKKYCKDKAKGSKSRRYKCFRPHAIDWMDKIVNHFNCNEI